MKYRKLISFDFDATLFHTALEDEGKTIWKEKTGEKWPYVGWWSKPETLDTTIFDTPLNRPVYNEYLKAVSDSDNFVILATGRIERLRPQVEAILNKNNLSFDGVFLKRGPGDTLYFKTKLFETFINCAAFSKSEYSATALFCTCLNCCKKSKVAKSTVKASNEELLYEMKSLYSIS